MADEADKTTEREDITIREAIRASMKPLGPLPVGRCHYCDEIVDDEARWCNTSCRDLWSRELALRGHRA